MRWTRTRNTRYSHGGTRQHGATSGRVGVVVALDVRFHRHASTSSSTARLDLPVESITLASAATSSGDGRGESEAGGVEPVPAHQVVVDRLHAATVGALAGPAPGPGLGGGGQVDLDVGVGEHDGADVAALRPPPCPARPPRPVGGPPSSRSHRGVGGHGRDRTVHLRGPDGVGGVLAVDEHALAHLDGRGPGPARPRPRRR